MASKTEDVINYILFRINRGSWTPGSKIPSQEQLCKTLSCSRTTVERAFSKLIHAGVLCGKQGSGTFVKATNNAGKIKREKIIVVVSFNCNSLQDNIFAKHPFLGMFLNLDTANMAMRLITFDHFQENFTQYLDGSTLVIAAWPKTQHFFWYEELRKRQVPVLIVNRIYDEFDCIYTDTVSAMREGMSWLVGKAGKKISLITRTPNMNRPYLQERVILFYELCMELGLDLKPEMIFRQKFPPEPDKEITDVCKHLFSGNDKPIAITILDCDMLQTFIECAEKFNKFCGKDYYIFTIDYDKKSPGIGVSCQNFMAFRPEIEQWITSVLSGNHSQFSRIIKARMEIC